MVTTRSASKMEEQLQLLIVKMDEQAEQPQLLTKQQSQKFDEVAKKQKTREQVRTNMAADLIRLCLSRRQTRRGGGSYFQRKEVGSRAGGETEDP